jgi:Pyridoxamine 5'-phosphate oxidase
VPTWSEVEVASPDLGTEVRDRFERYGLAVMATVRADGSPRVSGIELLFGLGELWMGMMEGSLKVADLRRDPRVALHCATIDKAVAEGDAKIAGVAVAVSDSATFAAYRAAFLAVNAEMPEGPFPLFRMDVHEISTLRPAGDHLDIGVWTPAGGLRRLERH